MLEFTEDNKLVLSTKQNNEFALLIYSGKISMCIDLQVIQESKNFSLSEMFFLANDLQKNVRKDVFKDYCDLELNKTKGHLEIVREMVQEEKIISFLHKLKTKKFPFVDIWLGQKT